MGTGCFERVHLKGVGHFKTKVSETVLQISLLTEPKRLKKKKKNLGNLCASGTR